jgi:hypothetical protein
VFKEIYYDKEMKHERTFNRRKARMLEEKAKKDLWNQRQKRDILDNEVKSINTGLKKQLTMNLEN